MAALSLKVSDKEQLEPEATDLPRTLIVDLSSAYGGSSSRVLSLMKHLPAADVALAALEKSSLAKYARLQGLSVHTVGHSKADPLIPYRLARIIRDLGFQVLDAQNIQSKFWSSLAAAGTGTAFISTLNSWYYEEHGARLKGRIYQILERATNYNLDLYIAVSRKIFESLVDAGVEPERIAVVQNTVDFDPASISADRAGLRRRYGLPADAVVCCAVGRLEWVKGYQDLVDAFGRVAGLCPLLYGLIIGQGRLNADLNDRIAGRGMQKRIRLVGFLPRDEVLATVKSCDFFVMPSHYEGTPVALLEAAALSRGILASRIGGIPDLVADEKEALLFEPGNIDELAAGLKRIYENPELNRNLGTKAGRRVEDRFSSRAQADATQQAYLQAWRHAQKRLERRWRRPLN